MQQPQENFVQYYLSQYCQHENVTTARHILTEHGQEVIDCCIKPTFPPLVQTLSLKQSRQFQRQRQKVQDDESFSLEQEWKKIRHGYSTVDILEFMLGQSSASEMETNLSKLIPFVLRVLDDYDVDYKHRGVLLVHTIINTLETAVITKMGLEYVFMDTLFKCLYYLSDMRDLPLLTSSYTCLMDLIDRTKAVDSKERIVLFEKVMTDGILPGLTYAGNKSSFLAVLLKQIDQLTKMLGTVLVRYLKLVLVGIGYGLETSDKELNQLALTALQHVMEVSSLRISLYSSTILKGLSTVWLHHYKHQDNVESQRICQHTKLNYRLLHSLCDDQLKTDTQALLDMDRHTFQELLI